MHGIRLFAVQLVSIAALVGVLSRSAAFAEQQPVAPCPPEITQCFCVVKSPGTYKVLNDLATGGSEREPPPATCLTIDAPEVVLDLNGKTMTGPEIRTSAIPEFIELQTTKKAAHAVIVGHGANLVNMSVVIEGQDSVFGGLSMNGDFAPGGVTVAGSQGVLLHDLQVGSGFSLFPRAIVIYRSNRVTIVNVHAADVGIFGSQHTLLTEFSVDAGWDDIQIDHGCICKDVRCEHPICQDSRDTKIIGGTVSNAGHCGITVVSGSHTEIIGVVAQDNSGGDMCDDNPGCGTDLWTDNVFDFANQTCIH